MSDVLGDENDPERVAVKYSLVSNLAISVSEVILCQCILCGE